MRRSGSRIDDERPPEEMLRPIKFADLALRYPEEMKRVEMIGDYSQYLLVQALRIGDGSLLMQCQRLGKRAAHVVGFAHLFQRSVGKHPLFPALGHAFP